MFEPDRKWLMNAAGWQAVKDGRRIVEAGGVEQVTFDGQVFKGSLASGGRRRAVAVRVNDRTRVDTHCQCATARRTGGMCEHAAALVLAWLESGNRQADAAGEASPSHASKEPARARGAGRAGDPDHSRHPSPPGKSGPARAGSSLPSLYYSLAPQFMRSLEKGALVVSVAARDAEDAPIRPLPKPLPFRPEQADPRDRAFLEWLVREGGTDEVPPTLMLQGSQVDRFLEAIAGHPGILLGAPGSPGSHSLRVGAIPVRRRLRLRLAKSSTGDDPRVALEHDGVDPRGGHPDRIVIRPAARQQGRREGPASPCDWVYSPSARLLCPLAAASPEVARLLGDRSGAAPVALDALVRHLDEIAGTCEFDDPDGILDRLDLRPGRPAITLGLAGDLNRLTASLRLSYEGVEIDAREADESEGIAATDDRFPIHCAGQPWRFVRRSPEIEKDAVDRLVEAGFSRPDRTGRLQLNGRDTALRFLGSGLPEAERLGWTVQLSAGLDRAIAGLDRLRPVLRIREPDGGDRGGITPRVQDPSRRGWLEFEVAFEGAGGRAVSSADVRQWLRAGSGGSRAPALIDWKGVEELEEALIDTDPRQEAPGRFRVARERIGYLEATVRSHGGSVESERRPAEIDPEILVTTDLWNQLRNYQREGVARLLESAAEGRGMLLADEMGLGKTVQVLAFLTGWKRLLAGGSRAAEAGGFLVVAPTSLLGNWASEAGRFAPEFSVMIWHGATRHERAAELDRHDLIITSYGLLDRDLELLSRDRPWGAVVLDEASAIKNPQTRSAKAARRIEADFRLALTGTPIENAVENLWSITEFVQPGYLGARRAFRDRFEMPIRQAAASGGARTVPELARLRRRIAPLVIRRTKREVAPDLPPKLIQIVRCAPTTEQAGAYRQLLEEAHRQVRDASRSGGRDRARMTMLTALLRLRQLCCDPRLLGGDHDDHPAVGSGKLTAFRELVAEALEGGHKFLVFSQFASMLRLLKAELAELGVAHAHLDGATVDREGEIRRFRQDPGVSAFLISLKAGGFGLNLTEADTVIHFDPWWNPAVENQATDRAHRIGQQAPVTVYKLILEGTVEEKILRLQREKQGVFDAALDDEAPLMGGLDEGDLERLLAEGPA